MHPISAPARRLFTASVRPALTQALPDSTRHAMEGLAGISPLHPRGDRALSLAHLRDAHVAGLQADWQRLSTQLHGSHDADLDEPLARQRAVVRNLHTVLTAGVRLLEQFHPEQVMAEPPAMREPLASQLRHESREATSVARVRELFSYASLVPPPQRRAMLGAPLQEAGARGRLHALCSRHDHRFLDEAALLMVRLYASPDHGTFNVLRAVHELDKSNPEIGAGAQFADLTGLFAQAIGGIYRLAPMRAPAPLFKGAVCEAFWRLQAGRAFTLERPLSSTRAREQSYLGRQPPDHPAYDHLLTYQDGALASQKVEAVDITLFHPHQNLHQREALVLPGQVFQVTAQAADELQSCFGRMPVQLVELQKIGRSPDWLRFAPYYGAGTGQ